MIKKVITNKLAKNSFIYSISSFLGLGISFFLLPLYTRVLNPELYGIYNTVLSIAGIFSIISLLGIDSAIARFYFDYYKNAEDLRKYLGSVFYQIYLIAFLITLFSAIAFYFIFGNFNGIGFYPYYFLAIVSSYVIVPYRVLLQLFRVEEKASKVFFFNIINLLLTVSFNVLALLVFKKGVLGILIATLTVNSIFSVVSLFYLNKYISLNMDVKNLKNTLRFSIPFLPHDFSNLALRNFDVVFIGMFVSLTESGIYSLGLKVAMIMEIILVSINNTWNPIFQKNAVEDPIQFSKVVERLTSIYSIVLLNMIFIVNIFANIIISVLASPKFLDSIKFVPVLTFIPLFKGFYFMFTQQVQFSKKMQYMPYSTIPSAILYIVLAYLLGYYFKSFGVAIASVFSTFVMAIFMLYFAQKAYKINYDKRILLMIIIYVILLLAYIEVLNLFKSYSFLFGVFAIIIMNIIGYKLFGFSKEDLIYFRYIDN